MKLSIINVNFIDIHAHGTPLPEILFFLDSSISWIFAIFKHYMYKPILTIKLKFVSGGKCYADVMESIETLINDYLNLLVVLSVLRKYFLR